MTLSMTLTSELFGQFISHLHQENLCVKIDFPANLVKQKKFWPNSNLSAKFVANYIGIFFPIENAQSEQQQRRRNEITDAARYIANELLENALKFSYGGSQSPIQMALYHYPDRLVTTVTNTTHVGNISAFRSLIYDLTTQDPNELYIERLERNIEYDNALDSGLGFITILINYNTKLGWEIEQSSPTSDVFRVTTMAQLLYE